MMVSYCRIIPTNYRLPYYTTARPALIQLTPPFPLFLLQIKCQRIEFE